MNFRVTGRAVGILRVQIMLRALRLNVADSVIHAVAGKTELRDGAEAQQPRIG